MALSPGGVVTQVAQPDSGSSRWLKTANPDRGNRLGGAEERGFEWVGIPLAAMFRAEENQDPAGPGDGRFSQLLEHTLGETHLEDRSLGLGSVLNRVFGLLGSHQGGWEAGQDSQEEGDDESLRHVLDASTSAFLDDCRSIVCVQTPDSTDTDIETGDCARFATRLSTARSDHLHAASSWNPVVARPVIRRLRTHADFRGGADEQRPHFG